MNLRNFTSHIPHDRSAFSSDFRLGAEWSRQAVGGHFNAEEFKRLLGGLGDLIVERA